MIKERIIVAVAVSVDNYLLLIILIEISFELKNEKDFEKLIEVDVCDYLN